MDRLTDVTYWDDQWWSTLRPQRLWLYRDFDYETIQLLKRTPSAAPSRLLEVGAGGSRVLPYLAKKLAYEVWGTDFSFEGCRLLRANLTLAGVPGKVVCEDMFQSSLPSGKFDLVYSSGLIEHFEDTRHAIAAHLSLLRPGGKLVLVVPNFQGFQGWIWRRLAPPLWAKHRVFGPADLAGFMSDLGIEQVHSGYLGSFFIHVGRSKDWSVVQRWPTWARKSVPISVRAVNGAISLGFRISPFRPHSRMFSTGFFAAGVKRGTRGSQNRDS